MHTGEEKKVDNSSDQELKTRITSPSPFFPSIDFEHVLPTAKCRTNLGKIGNFKALLK